MSYEDKKRILVLPITVMVILQMALLLYGFFYLT